MQEEEIAVEFVYYIEHGKFIPERYACEYSGFTAEKLHQEAGLTVPETFKRMACLAQETNS